MIDELLSRMAGKVPRLATGQPPRYIFLESTNHCNYKCPFCPNPDIEPSKKGFMEFGLYKKLIDDAFDTWGSRDITILPHLFGEPLLHERIGDMIAYASGRGFKTQMYTNGSLLDAEKSAQIIRSGLGRMFVSKPDLAYGQLKAFLSKRDELGSETPRVHLQVIGSDIAEIRRKRDVIRQGMAGYGYEGFEYKLFMDWGGLVKNRRGSGGGKVEVPCKYLWFNLPVTYNGDVAICCHDIKTRTTLGNARTQPLGDIWAGGAFEGVRSKHTSGMAHEISACRNCMVPRVGRAGSLSVMLDFLNYDVGQGVADAYHGFEKVFLGRDISPVNYD
jgi:radical SAM protein with 4Fe4S-binding SPASM domain